MKYLYAFFLVSFAFLLISCSSTQSSTEIQPGTPAFFWASAKDAHAKGNFEQAADSLHHLTISDNEFRARAEVWLMAISAGLARGDMEWVEDLKAGAKQARTKQAEFRKAANEASASANENAMQYAEAANAALTRGLPAEVSLAFVLPNVDANKPATEGKIDKGILPPAAELATIRAQWQKRSVMQSLARASGSGEDLAKAGTALANGELKVKADAWRLTMAKEFLALAEMYGPKKLDQEARTKLMLDKAKEALAPLPATAETKDAKKQLETLGKKLLKPTT